MRTLTHRGSRQLLAWLALLALGGMLAACAEEPGQTPTGGSAAAPSGPPGAAVALVIDSDVVKGPKNLTAAEKPVWSCVQAGKFAHNEQIVWRVKVVDGATGQPLDDAAMAAVEVKLPDQTLTLKYGGHPASAPVDSFWTTSWVVPEGYPSGSLAYSIVATAKDGRTATWEQFKVTAALLTVTDDVRAVIATPAPSATP